jgi:hypothetical protein
MLATEVGLVPLVALVAQAPMLLHLLLQHPAPALVAIGQQVEDC